MQIDVLIHYWHFTSPIENNLYKQLSCTYIYNSTSLWRLVPNIHDTFSHHVTLCCHGNGSMNSSNSKKVLHMKWMNNYMIGYLVCYIFWSFTSRTIFPTQHSAIHSGHSMAFLWFFYPIIYLPHEPRAHGFWEYVIQVCEVMRQLKNCICICMSLWKRATIFNGAIFQRMWKRF